MIRVGFTKIGGAGWQGGHNYLVNLLTFLLEYQSAEITPILFVEPAADEKEMSDYLTIDGLRIIRSPAFSETRKPWSLLQSLIIGHDPATSKVFRANSIDVVFEAARFFGWRLGIPAIAWIPDFQHRDFPEYFSRLSWWKRELGFRCQIASGRKVFLSSLDAKSSCEKYYRTDKGQIEIVRFAVPAIKIDRQSARADIKALYGIEREYFFMPNHFWKHKNHELVIEALAILKSRGSEDTLVVSTGNPLDERHKRHFEHLQTEIERLGVGQTFVILGQVPYSHVRLLMAGCKGLLNPSLYEGWSTTVEEAKSIGAPMLLSDLVVHKEQAVHNVSFFDRYSASSLADALSDFALSWVEDEPTCTARATRATKKFAAEFLEMLKSVSCEGKGRVASV